MTTFRLIRHGLKVREIGDVPLTEAGLAQARLAAGALRERKIAAIVSSPLLRARETAVPLARETGRSAVVDDRLRERANWGDVPGQTFAEFVAVWERCTREPDYIPPSGDSARQAARRMTSALTDWASRYPPGVEIVFVTHGGLITDFLSCAFSEQELENVCPGFAARQSELIPECSITDIGYDGGCFRLGKFADTGHLRQDG
ncbi:histidine phosphatase family protein [Saccharibacillus sp. CPCC 101409]|uniref:histidine phosphatase family protein n=1 Tax=Saccharibacillus sp. CPCC 101409 TaxID=3058041 RepID=UPI002672BEE9|nr:histidine phosphatase family protein [Saccharibacillus sp. CPCC 101409]MDO3408160.1 histidine phosphatase family protein [Saccharibacillus sp. CPCC 101409]